MVILLVDKGNKKSLGSIKKLFFNIAPDIFISGKMSLTVKNEIWKIIVEKEIKATMIYNSNTEQKFYLKSNQFDIIDLDGLNFRNFLDK